MIKTYLCSCESHDTTELTLIPTEVDSEGICIKCEHYAFYGEYEIKNLHTTDSYHTKETKENARKLFIEYGNIAKVSRILNIRNDTVNKWKHIYGWTSPNEIKKYPAKFRNKVKKFYQDNNFDIKLTAKEFQIEERTIDRWSISHKWKGKKHRTTKQKLKILKEVKDNTYLEKVAKKYNVTTGTLRVWKKKLLGNNNG